MKRSIGSAVILGVSVLTGCGSLDVSPEGTLASPIVVAAVTSEDEVVLTCDQTGNLTVNGQALDLPVVREDARLGLRLVDASWLPAVWRPPHALDGGFLVTRLHKASPLALRGLRPLDRILSLNGKPLGKVEAVAQRLRDSRRLSIRLTALHPDGREFTVEAKADERVGASTKIHIPLLFERRRSSLGEAFACGPLDVFFHWRTRRTHTYVADHLQGHSQYRENFEWGALANMIGYRRQRDPLTGAEKNQVTVFWVFRFGDDL
ncbi:MAG: hypothetical protein JKY65_12205 [Planctomycetes bacterium]|nr:hypothetical protein [Planctomycetota bacterium]